MLDELLSENSRRLLAETGYLEVPSPSVDGRVYRVPARPGRVEVYQSGKLFLRVCVEPVEPLPEADVVLMHRLIIEGDEKRYLQAAHVLNVSPVTGLVDWRDVWCGLGRQCSAASLCGVAELALSTSGTPGQRDRGEEAMKRA